MRTETVYWNVTGKGDIDAYVVVVTDDPQNQVHKAHALLKQTLRSGIETVRDRLSFSSRKDAEIHASRLDPPARPESTLQAPVVSVVRTVDCFTFPLTSRRQNDKV